MKDVEKFIIFIPLFLVLFIYLLERFTYIKIKSFKSTIKGNFYYIKDIKIGFGNFSYKEHHGEYKRIRGNSYVEFKYSLENENNYSELRILSNLIKHKDLEKEVKSIIVDSIKFRI